MRILTWNIGRVYLLGESRAAGAALDHVAGVIADLDPDVAALQELKDAGQVDRIVELLGPRYRGVGADHSRSDRVVGMLAKPAAEFEQVPIASGRRAIAVRMTNGGGPTHVVGIHFDAFDAGRRQREAAELVAWAERHGGDVVFAGDFNFDPGLCSPRGPDARTYDLLCEDFRDVGASAGPTTLLGHRRLDWILVRSASLGRADAHVLGGRRVGLMDHDPVLAELDLSAD